jgi:hypothetical protein
LGFAEQTADMGSGSPIIVAVMDSFGKPTKEFAENGDRFS